MRSVVFAVLVGACGYAPVPASLDGATGDDAPPATGDAPPDLPSPSETTHRIDVVGGKVIGGPHADFPLLVSTTQPFLKTIAVGGEVANASGFDIHFSLDAAGAMPLAHEVERYEGGTGRLVAWVKIPMLTSTTTLFIRYGDPAITSSQEQRQQVWSAGYRGVWHLSNDVDSTSGTAATNTNAAQVAGQVADGHAFDGSTSVVVVEPTAANQDVFVGGGTIEAWINPTTTGEGSFGRVMEKGSLLSMGIGDGNGVIGSYRFGYVFSGGAGNWVTGAGVVPLSSWTHATVVYDSSSAANLPKIYLDGVERAVSVVSSPSGTPNSDAGLQIGIGDRVSGGRAFAGMIDEARWSHAIRSDGWIATTHANQRDPGGFLTIAP